MSYSSQKTETCGSGNEPSRMHEGGGRTKGLTEAQKAHFRAKQEKNFKKLSKRIPADKEAGVGQSTLRLDRNMLGSKYFKNLSAMDVVVLVHVASFHNGRNNGHIPVNVTDLARALRKDKKAVSESLRRLGNFGFLVKTKPSRFASHDQRLAGEYRVSFLPKRAGEFPGLEWSCGKIQLPKKLKAFAMIPNRLLHSREYSALPWVSKFLFIWLCVQHTGLNNTEIPFSPAAIIKLYPELSRQRIYNNFKPLERERFVVIETDATPSGRKRCKEVRLTCFPKHKGAMTPNAWKRVLD